MQNSFIPLAADKIVKTMTYGSVCSGIEAATAAWHQLGWKTAWFSEIAPFPCRLLAHYYPNTPNLGDMLNIHEKETFKQSNIDLLVGGTPCQSFSIAGLRGGLADARGNLALQFCRILTIKRPRWFIWENVPGVFSSKKGEDFRSILRGFSECGYSVAYRVLDAKFFGVPQRRRRVFVIGYLGNDWRPPAAVLFEPEGLRRDPAKSSSKGQKVAGTIGRRTDGSSVGTEEAAGNQRIAGTLDANYGRLQGASGQDACHGHSTLVYGGNNTSGPIDVAAAIQNPGRLDFESETFVVKYFEARVGRNDRGGLDDVAAPLKAKSGETGKGDGAPCIMWSIMPMNSTKDYKARQVEVTQPVTTQQGISNNGGDIVQQFPQIFTQNERDELRYMNGDGQMVGALSAQPGKQQPFLHHKSIVRRLTPLECERLQGFPDNYTVLKDAADSPRYESIGNSMAVPVMAWIGRRIESVDRQFNP